MIKFKNQIKLLTIEKNKTIGEAIEKINLNKMKTVFVIDNKSKKYIGSVTDGDLRRGMLKNLSTNNGVMSVVKKKSIFFKKKPSLRKLNEAFSKNFVQCIPYLDSKNKISEIFISTPTVLL